MWWLLLFTILAFLMLFMLGLARASGKYDAEIEAIYLREQEIRKAQNEDKEE